MYEPVPFQTCPAREIHHQKLQRCAQHTGILPPLLPPCHTNLPKNDLKRGKTWKWLPSCCLFKTTLLLRHFNYIYIYKDKQVYNKMPIEIIRNSINDRPRALGIYKLGKHIVPPNCLVLNTWKWSPKQLTKHIPKRPSCSILVGIGVLGILVAKRGISFNVTLMLNTLCICMSKHLSRDFLGKCA